MLTAARESRSDIVVCSVRCIAVGKHLAHCIQHSHRYDMLLEGLDDRSIVGHHRLMTLADWHTAHERSHAADTALDLLASRPSCENVVAHKH